MHLSEKVFDNLEAFMGRVKYVLNDTDDNDFIGAYTPDYSFNSNSLDKDAPGYDYLCCAENLENIAARCLCSYTFFNRVFKYKGAVLKPCEVYELGYWFYLHYKMEAVYEPLSIAIADILKGISFTRIPDEEFDDETQILSEWAIADNLFSIDARNACGIISKLAIDAAQKTELKKYIIRGDKDGFISYLIENNINTYMLQVACTLIMLGKQFEVTSHAKDLESEELEKVVSETMENPELELSPTIFKFYHSCLHNWDALSYENIVSHVYSSEILKVQMVQHLKHFSTNVVAVNEFEKILRKHPELENTSIDPEDMENGALVNPRFPIFEDFKERYVSETCYPPSVGKEKPSKSWYRYNEDSCKWKEESIFYLYQRLVDYGFLAWDEEVLYSFMYRMCRDYKPDWSDPSPIVWNGDITSLWSVISHFHAETSKMDNLTRSFFLKQDGFSLGKNDGGKNSTHSRDPRIKELLQDPMFKKV